MLDNLKENNHVSGDQNNIQRIFDNVDHRFGHNLCCMYTTDLNCPAIKMSRHICKVIHENDTDKIMHLTI